MINLTFIRFLCPYTRHKVKHRLNVTDSVCGIHGQKLKAQSGEEGVRDASLLFADDAVLFVSSDRDIQHVLQTVWESVLQV